jgi:hypothetical protein
MSINSIDNEILVTVNGVVMKKNEDYTIENGNLVFKVAPEINDRIRVLKEVREDD